MEHKSSHCENETGNKTESRDSAQKCKHSEDMGESIIETKVPRADHSINETTESYVALGCDVCDFVSPKGLENKEQQRQFDEHFLEKRHSVSSKVNIVIKTNEHGEKEAVKVSVVVKAAYYAE